MEFDVKEYARRIVKGSEEAENEFRAEGEAAVKALGEARDAFESSVNEQIAAAEEAVGELTEQREKVNRDIEALKAKLGKAILRKSVGEADGCEKRIRDLEAELGQISFREDVIRKTKISGDPDLYKAYTEALARCEALRKTDSEICKEVYLACQEEIERLDAVQYAHGQYKAICSTLQRSAVFPAEYDNIMNGIEAGKLMQDSREQEAEEAEKRKAAEDQKRKNEAVREEIRRRNEEIINEAEERKNAEKIGTATDGAAIMRTKSGKVFEQFSF